MTLEQEGGIRSYIEKKYGLIMIGIGILGLGGLIGLTILGEQYRERLDRADIEQTGGFDIDKGPANSYLVRLHMDEAFKVGIERPQLVRDALEAVRRMSEGSDCKFSSIAPVDRDAKLLIVTTHCS